MPSWATSMQMSARWTQSALHSCWRMERMRCKHLTKTPPRREKPLHRRQADIPVWPYLRSPADLKSSPEGTVTHIMTNTEFKPHGCL